MTEQEQAIKKIREFAEDIMKDCVSAVGLLNAKNILRICNDALHDLDPCEDLKVREIYNPLIGSERVTIAKMNDGAEIEVGTASEAADKINRHINTAYQRGKDAGWEECKASVLRLESINSGVRRAIRDLTK